MRVGLEDLEGKSLAAVEVRGKGMKSQVAEKTEAIWPISFF